MWYHENSTNTVRCRFDTINIKQNQKLTIDIPHPTLEGFCESKLVRQVNVLFGIAIFSALLYLTTSWPSCFFLYLAKQGMLHDDWTMTMYKYSQRLGCFDSFVILDLQSHQAVSSSSFSLNPRWRSRDKLASILIPDSIPQGFIRGGEKNPYILSCGIGILAKV